MTGVLKMVGASGGLRTGDRAGGGPARRRGVVLAGVVHEVGEQPAQPRAGLEELALGAAGRDPELGGDLLVRVPLDVVEQEDGALIAVVEVKARYKAPARYDEELVVRTRLASVRGAIVRFTYAIVRATDEAVLCEGETVHVVVGRDMKRRPMPPRYAERFRAVLGDAGIAEGAANDGGLQNAASMDDAPALELD